MNKKLKSRKIKIALGKVKLKSGAVKKSKPKIRI